jgi:transcriptional regulator with XRE-family HTH domain
MSEPIACIDRIKSLLLQRGWTWKQLASRTPDIDPSRYARWNTERKSHPDAVQLMQIAQALGCSVGELVGEQPLPQTVAPRDEAATAFGHFLIRVGHALAKLEDAVSRIEEQAARDASGSPPGPPLVEVDVASLPAASPVSLGTAKKKRIAT